MNDHGPVHMQIVANIALRLLRLLLEYEVKPNIVTDDEGFTPLDAEVVRADRHFSISLKRGQL